MTARDQQVNDLQRQLIVKGRRVTDLEEDVAVRDQHIFDGIKRPTTYLAARRCDSERTIHY